MRVDTQTILTIQNHVITKNHRVGVTYTEKKTWQLRIKDIRESDRGWYMCQINSMYTLDSTTCFLLTLTITLPLSLFFLPFPLFRCCENHNRVVGVSVSAADPMKSKSIQKEIYFLLNKKKEKQKKIDPIFSLFELYSTLCLCLQVKWAI